MLPAALYSTVLVVDKFNVEKLFGKLLPDTPPDDALNFNFDVELSANVPPKEALFNVFVPKSRTEEPFTVKFPIMPVLDDPVKVTIGLFEPVPIITLLKFPTLLFVVNV